MCMITTPVDPLCSRLKGLSQDLGILRQKGSPCLRLNVSAFVSPVLSLQEGALEFCLLTAAEQRRAPRCSF